MNTRIDHLLKQMNQRQIDSALITSKANIYYFSNYLTDPHERLVAIFVDQKGHALLILPEMEEKDAMAAGWSEDILSYNDDTDPWVLLKNYVEQTGHVPESMAVEKDNLSLTRGEIVAQSFPNSEIKDATDLLNQLRVQKDQKEFQLLKQAAQLADFGVKTGIKAIEEGKSEMEIVAEIEYALKREGVSEMSFSTLVLAGDKTSSPHGNPGKQKVEPGNFVLFDLGVVYEGYCSDITRTVAYKHASAEQEKIYNTVLKAEKAAIDACEIGRPVGDIDKTARHLIDQAGYGKYFMHRIGHGLGIDVHEHPSMSGNNTLPLKEGMCFTIEPGIYIPEVGGVRIEDDIFMTEKGPEILTSYPKDLQIIG
ncbi:aminopeptidase P family protein [Virgibacillus sp. MSP4-1]|uniref:M24 family metallopeptidase n=1 Tax=Virgibacillus sp. MSP4-1 TaxID=2700081 RepID=UPI0003AACC5D|nr:Xaa-Pro peptidase family protein [Virgibacillus sp. MSP4-1]QHS23015.1 aminopeptidase P family protein [Virgibacillus sp. MSP4-1]